MNGRSSALSDTVFLRNGVGEWSAGGIVATTCLKGEVAMEVNFAGGSRGTKDVGYPVTATAKIESRIRIHPIAG